MIELVTFIAMFILVLFVVLPVFLAIVLLAMRYVTYIKYRHVDGDMRQAKKPVAVGRS